MAKATGTAVAKSASEPITIAFTLAKQTKNALRYQEDDTDSENRGKIGTLYVQKTTLPTTPEHITVTISAS